MNDSEPFPVKCTCSQCGFSLTVTHEDAADIPGDLSARHQARVVLEDHGWSYAEEPPLCSACSS